MARVPRDAVLVRSARVRSARVRRPTVRVANVFSLPGQPDRAVAALHAALPVGSVVDRDDV
jgi:hypothetical protein